MILSSATTEHPTYPLKVPSFWLLLSHLVFPRMICVECSSEVPSLYTEFANGYIKLTYCNACNAVSDKYVEFDLVILFIDILLLKPQAYKHLIFNVLLNQSAANGNRSSAEPVGTEGPKVGPVNSFRSEDKQRQRDNHNSENTHQRMLQKEEQFEWYDVRSRFRALRHWVTEHTQLARLTVSFILFEVYLNWAYEELKPRNTVVFSEILKKLTIVQYFFFLVQCVCEFMVGHVMIQLVIYVLHGRHQNNTPKQQKEQTNEEKNYGEQKQKNQNEEETQVTINKGPTSDVEKRQSFTLCSREAIYSAVLIAGGTKLYPILMLIWPYDSQLSTSLINNYFTSLTLIEALRITVGLRLHTSIAAVLVSLMAKKVVSSAVVITLSKTMLAKELAGWSAMTLALDEFRHFESNFVTTCKSLFDLA